MQPSHTASAWKCSSHCLVCREPREIQQLAFVLTINIFITDDENEQNAVVQCIKQGLAGSCLILKVFCTLQVTLSPGLGRADDPTRLATETLGRCNNSHPSHL